MKLNYNFLLIGLLIFIIGINLFTLSNIENMSFEADNYDVEYHESPEEIEKQNDFGLDLQPTYMYDPESKQVVGFMIPNNQIQQTYNSIGHYKYGNQKYVPNYEDSILLSSAYNDKLPREKRNPDDTFYKKDNTLITDDTKELSDNKELYDKLVNVQSN